MPTSRRAAGSVEDWPNHRTSPSLGRSSDARQRSSVVFPAPLAPVSTTHCPAATSKSIASSTAQGAEAALREASPRNGRRLLGHRFGFGKEPMGQVVFAWRRRTVSILLRLALRPISPGGLLPLPSDAAGDFAVQFLRNLANQVEGMLNAREEDNPFLAVVEPGDEPGTRPQVNVPIETVVASKKVVNVKEQYNTERLRPYYKSFEDKPLFMMTSES